MKPAALPARRIASQFSCLRGVRVLLAALALGLLFGPATAEDFAPDQLIVVFAPKVVEEKKQTLHQTRGHKTLKNLRGINGRLVKLNSKKSVADAIAEYQRDPEVRFAEPNYIVHEVAAPNDVYFSSLWGFQNSGQSILGVPGVAGADIRASQAWSITTGSEDIVVGVVDGGVDYSHPDLALNIWTNPGGINGGPAGSHGYNAIAKSFDPKDQNGHGTHVAGIIGAQGNNSMGVVGVNWRVTIMPLKFLDATGSGTVADAIDAIDFAIDAKKSGVNVRVLNNSWGGSGFSQALLNEIKLAAENDILFVTAAGNSSANNDTSNFFPANYDAPNIITVAATDNKDLLATFSNYGLNSVELGAPGVNILSTYYTPSSSGYAWASGTSMAAPQVAGAAALVLANGYQSVTTLRNTLVSTVDPVSSLATKTITGGRLNVYNALLAMAVSVTPVSPVLNPGESLVLTSTVSGGGTPPFSYAWSNSAGPLGETGTSITVNAIDTYSCTVTDSSIPPKTSTGSATLLDPTPVLTWPIPADIVYGTPLSEVQLNATADLPGVFEYSRDAGTVLSPGSYTLTVTFTPEDSAYNSVSGSVILKVLKAPLQIQANNTSKLYGAAVPSLTASYTGFVNDDSPSTLTTLPSLTTTATITSPANTYPITVSGATTPYYNITFVNGTLSVTPAPLTISAVDKTKAYKASLPSLTVLYSGFVNGDTYSKLSSPVVLATTATTASPVAVYPITVSGATSSNYTITFVNASLTITPLPLKITAANKTKTYGAAIPALTASYSGFASGETSMNLETQPLLTTTATAASPIGVYPITVTGASSRNYTITYVSGVLTNNPATLSISAVAKTKYYGAVTPALTASYSGFVNGDTVATLLTPPVMECSVNQSSPVGVYPITISGATASNYTIKFVNSTFTVRAATLSIRAVSKSKNYGAAVPALTYTTTGFVLGETEAILTSPVTISCPATVSSVVGTYPISVSGGTNSNYAVLYVNSLMTVKGAPLSVKAVSKSKVYGAAMPALTYTATGFVLGETEANLITPVAINSTATASSSAGTYPITVNGATAANYTISFVSASLTISKAPLTIKADNLTKTLTAPLPPLTYSITGLVNGDTEASLDIPVSITTTATATSPLGQYYITPSAALDPNYTITFVKGLLTITP